MSWAKLTTIESDVECHYWVNTALLTQMRRDDEDTLLVWDNNVLRVKETPEEILLKAGLLATAPPTVSGT